MNSLLRGAILLLMAASALPAEGDPHFQILLPGFSVRPLPIQLRNVNNVKYREDGRLVAVGYDGDVHLLTDTDGDGLEDRADLFWKNDGRLRSPIGLALTPPGYAAGRGVVVAAKGRCSLIVDTDGDDRGDREIVIAKDWKEIPHGVDALGVAFDRRDGSIYFGLGATNFTNAYLVDGTGAAQYRLDSERGTILKVSPDFSTRSIVCTGVRFPVALAFNAAGDLFCTDQEGATWLPNGNPFDELLHIQPGRHYGFPPRHSRHLPGVIDEPSVFDYGPQHQSTCGLAFNEPVNGGPVFGPETWTGDAIVTGYSRGKLWLTSLVKTPAGYVARSRLLACLGMLAVDACVSPRGDLVVAAHSGGPDWGSGPQGAGRLFKIVRADRPAPQPTAIWTEGPEEVRVAWDRPLPAEWASAVSEKARIVAGRHVAAGDRFESLRPGYDIVRLQQAALRAHVAVSGASLSSDRRTLILKTAPHRLAVGHALQLPGFPDAAAVGIRQEAAIDLDYGVTGVQVEGAAAGWIPHLDLAVSRALTRGSAVHDALWDGLRGAVTLKTQLDLTDLLRPAVQPGASIDTEWPTEKATLVFSSAAPLRAATAERAVSSEPSKGGAHVAELTLDVVRGRPVPLEVAIDGAAGLAVSWRTAEDLRLRALPLRRMLLPWAAAPAPEPHRAGVLPAELAGGSWGRGRHVFFSETAACFKCHAVHGRGSAIGPDLSNLVHRDLESVRRDIAEPSFAINPDHLSYLVKLRDGRILSGAVRTSGESLEIGDAKGEIAVVRRADVEGMKQSALSVMPEGLPKAIGEERMKDLLTFLLMKPPAMPQAGKRPPPPRRRAEVQAVLAGAPNPPEKTRPLTLVLVAGAKDHGPGEHDYPAWRKAWGELLAGAAATEVRLANDWPSEEDLRKADVLVFYQKGTWTPARAKDLDVFLERGGGAVYIHYAVDGGKDPDGFARRIGLAWRGGASKFRHGDLELDFSGAAGHPAARNLSKLKLHDESYWNLVGDPANVTLIASGAEESAPRPLVWSVEQGKGRVFVSIPGHFNWSFNDPLFRVLLLRGIAWSAREPVDRFNDLVPLGASLTD